MKVLYFILGLLIVFTGITCSIMMITDYSLHKVLSLLKEVLLPFSIVLFTVIIGSLVIALPMITDLNKKQ